MVGYSSGSEGVGGWWWEKAERVGGQGGSLSGNGDEKRFGVTVMSKTEQYYGKFMNGKKDRIYHLS